MVGGSCSGGKIYLNVCIILGFNFNFFSPAYLLLLFGSCVEMPAEAPPPPPPPFPGHLLRENGASAQNLTLFMMWSLLLALSSLNHKPYPRGPEPCGDVKPPVAIGLNYLNLCRQWLSWDPHAWRRSFGKFNVASCRSGCTAERKQWVRVVACGSSAMTPLVGWQPPPPKE